MAKQKRRTSRTTTTTRAIARAGHRLSAALTKAQKTSERAVSSTSRAVEAMGGDVSAIPTSELRRIVEQSFKSAEEVLQAQRAFALGLIDAVEANKPSRKRAPAKVATMPPAKRAIAS